MTVERLEYQFDYIPEPAESRLRRTLDLKIGVEPDVAFAKQAHDRGIPVIRAYAEHLPFRANTFDGIICKVVISLTLEDQAISELSRVAKHYYYWCFSFSYLLVSGLGKTPH
jgi:hypothetical protein